MMCSMGDRIVFKDKELQKQMIYIAMIRKNQTYGCLISIVAFILRGKKKNCGICMVKMKKKKIFVN